MASVCAVWHYDAKVYSGDSNILTEIGDASLQKPKVVTFTDHLDDATSTDPSSKDARRVFLPPVQGTPPPSREGSSKGRGDQVDLPSSGKSRSITSGSSKQNTSIVLNYLKRNLYDDTGTHPWVLKYI